MSKKPENRLPEVRQAIEGKKAERAQLQRVAGSREEAIEALEDWIDRNRRRFEERSGDAAERFIAGRGGAQLGHVFRGNNGERSYDETLCALFPEAVRTHFVAQIDAQLGDEQPPSRAERDQRLAEVDAELLELEREEEELVQRVPGAERRPDADPRAFLGLDSPPLPPAPMAEDDSVPADRGRPVAGSEHNGDIV